MRKWSATKWQNFFLALVGGVVVLGSVAFAEPETEGDQPDDGTGRPMSTPATVTVQPGTTPTPPPDFVPEGTMEAPSPSAAAPGFVPTTAPPGAEGATAAVDMSAIAAATPTPSEGKISLVFNDAPIERVVAELSRKSGKNIAARGKTVGQKITIIAREMPLERILDIIVNQKPNWLWYPAEGRPDTFEIWDQESFRAEVLPKQVRQKVFVPREITAEEAYKAIQGVLTPNVGAASFDPRSNKVIVTDLPYVLELVQRLIEQIDVKFVTRVFYIAHADVTSIAEKLSNMKSPAAPAPEVDERTHQIIVRDRLEVIRQMELLVETLDIGPEMRVYDLNNIGWEGADRQDLEDAISEILTPNAFYKINVQSGKLIVEDVPEVHEKIEKILEAFDKPGKQVLIQAEIIETAFREGLSYGTDWTISGDLFSSVIDGLTGRSTASTGDTGSGGSSGTGSGNVQGGSVPVGSGTLDKTTLGFLDFRKEFPIFSGGSGGLTGQFLSRHAYISLKAAMNDARTRVLQQPRAIVKNQKEVAFSVGEKVPFFTGGVYTTSVRNDTTGFTATELPQQNLINVGLNLNIRPTIYNNGLIEMEVEISNDSAVITQRIFNDKKYDAVGTKNQEIQSTLIIPSGETRVIGGLVRQDRNESRSGIPGLVKIPVVGPLLFGKFDKPSEQNGRQMLLIFLTPTIVSDKPTDTLKYKGRIVTSEEEALTNEPSQVAETWSDMALEPLAPPEILKSAFEPLGSKADKRDRMRSEVMARPTPPTSADIERSEEEPETNSGMQDLKRMRIQEKTTTGTEAFAPRIVGPRGALTGSETGQSRTGQPQIPTPSSGVSAVPGAPGVLSPQRPNIPGRPVYSQSPPGRVQSPPSRPSRPFPQPNRTETRY